MDDGANTRSDDDRRSVDRGASERRAHPRFRTLLTGLIVDAGLNTVRCAIVNRSEGGFRLRLSDDNAPPANFLMIDVREGVAHEAQTVWSNLPLLGARSTKAHRLATAQDGLGRALQSIWRSAL